MGKYFYKSKGWLALTVLFRIIGAIMQVFIAVIAEKIVDSAVNKELGLFKKVIAVYILYIAGISLVEFLTNATQAKYIKKVLTSIKSDFFKSLMKKKYYKFYQGNTSDYISKMTNDINLIEENYILPRIMIIGDFFILGFTIALLVKYSLAVTIVLIVSGLIAFILPAIFGSIINKKQRELSEKLSGFTECIKQHLEGFSVIKSFNVEKDIIDEFDTNNAALEEARYKKSYVSAIAQGVSWMAGAGSQVAGICFAAYLVLKGDLTAGKLVAVVQLSNGVLNPIMWIIDKVTKIKSMKDVNNRFLGIIDKDDNTFESKEVNIKDIEFNNINFAYDEKSKVLSDVNVKFEKGKKYLIIGQSGCGKSTLTRLLLGYYDNYVGDIKVASIENDKEDIVYDDIKDKNFNKNIAVIEQDCYMFNKTIKENICLYKEYSDEEINNVIEISGLTDFINALPDGINTLVTENGKNLSGGQKQRIAIARALIHNTQILIFDEATSSLDMETALDIEHKIMALEDKIVIAISHKLYDEVVREYDNILVMSEGRIVESGIYETMINSGSRLRDLMMAG